MTMFLYVFRPAKNWSYCGGTIIITTTHFEECARVFAEKNTDEDEKPKFFKTDEEAILEKFEWDNWVLERVFQLANVIQEETILVDYNWG